MHIAMHVLDTKNHNTLRDFQGLSSDLGLKVPMFLLVLVWLMAAFGHKSRVRVRKRINLSYDYMLC